MSGWISLHRKILKNAILKRNKQYSNFEAWVWLLLRANYDDAKVVIGGTIYRLKEGQMITSLKKLQLQFGWGNSRLNTFLKLLKDDGMIEYKSNTQLTQITILNYSELQGFQTANKSQPTHKQTATKLPPNTNNKNINKENKEIRTHKFFKKVEHIFNEKYNVYPKSILAEFCSIICSFFTRSLSSALLLLIQVLNLLLISNTFCCSNLNCLPLGLDSVQ